MTKTRRVTQSLLLPLALVAWGFGIWMLRLTGEPEWPQIWLARGYLQHDAYLKFINSMPICPMGRSCRMVFIGGEFHGVVE